MNVSANLYCIGFVFVENWNLSNKKIHIIYGVLLLQNTTQPHSRSRTRNSSENRILKYVVQVQVTVLVSVFQCGRAHKAILYI